MTDLVTRLQRLSGSNPVAFVKLVPEDWPEIERLIAAAEKDVKRIKDEGLAVQTVKPFPP